MKLTPDDIKKLEAVATERGWDAKELVSEAAQLDDGQPDSPGDAPPAGAKDAGGAKAADAPAQKLFMYHLPFVRVREVRKLLGLTESFPGDDQVASDWATEHPVGGSGGSGGDPGQGG